MSVDLSTILSSIREKPITGRQLSSQSSSGASTSFENTNGSYRDSVRISAETLSQIEKLREESKKAFEESQKTIGHVQEARKERVRQKIELLKQKIEIIKLKLRFASKKSLKALVREFERTLNDYKSLARQVDSLGSGGSLNSNAQTVQNEKSDTSIDSEAGQVATSSVNQTPEVNNKEKPPEEEKNIYVQIYEENEKRFNAGFLGTGKKDEDQNLFEKELDHLYEELKKIRNQLDRKIKKALL